MKKNSFLMKLVLVVSFFSVQCTQAPVQNASTQNPRKIAAAASTSNPDWLEALPGNGTEFQKTVALKLSPMIKRGEFSSETGKVLINRIAKYLGFLLYNYNEVKPAATAESKARLVNNILTRLLSSSTQFIMCPDLSDYVCLEKVPAITPSLPMRVEDPKMKLGEVTEVNENLEERMEWFFTKQILIPEKDVNLDQTLAHTLSQKIQDEGKDGIYMALYGIDDIEKSMKSVYQALTDKINAGVDVKAVFDQNGLPKGGPTSLVFSYVQPTKPADVANWILTPTAGEKTNLAFQYNGGTQGLIRSLARNAVTDDDAKGRIEFKNDGIMHNKFFVFKKGGELSVWTGTANVARTCMGTERNSNMGIFIRSTAVARSFLDEFNEMYTFQSSPKTDVKFRGRSGPAFPYGRFHSDKIPNTHRLFHFAKDDSDLKVYFSPTDDGEHRAILPMLHSARSGDVIRISMFGGAGIEYVRALQFAAARGVKVEIIVDSPTAFGTSSWAGKPAKSESTLLEANPYDSRATIDLKKNGRGDGQAWKQNHQKIGILLRQVGTGFLPEQIIVGSQNWSSSGNDKNDENLLAIRNRSHGLKAVSDFDEHFRSFLWPNAVNIDQKDPVSAGDDENSEEAN